MCKGSLTYQAKPDGTIELDIQSPAFSDDELRQTIEEAIGDESWKFKLLDQEKGLLIYNLIVGNILMELYVYIFNVRSSSRGRAKEQRIQLNSNISIRGFEFINSRTRKSLILGIYRKDSNTIFCAWDAKKKNNNGKQKSCYISIETLATAMRDGLAKKKDGVGDIAYAFKPEFLHYYIMNLEELHSG